jgi:hypothetical protein
MPKPAILDVIAAQKARFSVRELLNAAYTRRPAKEPAVQDHRRDRRRILGRRFDRQDRGQGSGRPAAYHQYAGSLQHPKSAAGPAETAQGRQQTHPLRRPVGAGADGRAVRHRGALRDAARSGNRGAEQGGRRRGARQSPRHGQVSGRCAQGRERVRTARRGRSIERGRNLKIGQIPARSYCRQRLVGAHPGCRRPRQNRRSARGRCGARAHQGRKSGHSARRHRDPQPDQGRARGGAIARSHQGPRLVGKRARRRCARGDRQHQVAAAIHRDVGEP